MYFFSVFRFLTYLTALHWWRQMSSKHVSAAAFLLIFYANNNFFLLYPQSISIFNDSPQFFRHKNARSPSVMWTRQPRHKHDPREHETPNVVRFERFVRPRIGRDNRVGETDPWIHRSIVERSDAAAAKYLGGNTDVDARVSEHATDRAGEIEVRYRFYHGREAE